MYRKTEVVICYVGETETVHRIVVAMCGAAWDAGAELRVRSAGGAGACQEPPDDTGGRELGGELETIPPATVQDLEWSDVALFGIALPHGEIPLAVAKLIDNARGRWRTGRLAEKLHYMLAPAAIRRETHPPIDADVVAAEALGRAAAEGTLTNASTYICI